MKALAVSDCSQSRRAARLENATGPIFGPHSATMWPTPSASSCCGKGPFFWMDAPVLRLVSPFPGRAPFPQPPATHDVVDLYFPAHMDTGSRAGKGQYIQQQ